MTAEGSSLLEGNRNMSPGDEEDTGPRSFAWRGGVERMTTGIWMWSEPFVRRTEGGKEVAVLLVDTQGMFDNETSMGLTACIFAVSTLVSAERKEYGCLFIHGPSVIDWSNRAGSLVSAISETKLGFAV